MLFLTVFCVLLAFEAVTVSAQYDYNEVLHKSILFYEAQRSGRLPVNNRIPYRGDSALGDQGNSGEDLTGGYYDAGDYVKFNFPQGMAMVTLCWGAYEFEDAYRDAGEWNNMLDLLRWGFDYMLKCHYASNNYYGQVGQGNLDHSYWGRPEEMTMQRPAWQVTAAQPGSDLTGEAAAALACGNMVFRTSDAAYAATLLDNARRLYTFAYNNRGLYSNSISDANEYYSSNSFVDELAWGATWLYRATNEQAYLNQALEFATTGGTAWAYDWSDKTVGYQLLLTILGQAAFSAPLERFLTNWFPGGTVPYTPKGLAWLSMWGSNRYSANTAFIAAVSAKYNILTTNSVAFAVQQIHYILGSGGRSFVCGFGVNPPVRPHHASSSCKDLPAPCTWEDYALPTPNPQTLWGAMVGGPGLNDDYEDDRSDYVKNEVSLDYNAGFQSAVAGLKYLGA